jgi:thymidylate synthase (FAD)
MVRLVDESCEIYPLEALDGICMHIERCGRTCYKSENMITMDTAIPFIAGILKSGHESVIEHANVIFSMPITDNNRQILEMKDVRGLNVSVEKDSQDGLNKIIVSGNMRSFRDIARQYDIHDFLSLIGISLFYIKENAQNRFSDLKIEGVQQSRFSEMHNYVTTHLVCDVGAYKDVTRHRLASFSIESTRFCNYSKGKFGSELTMMKPCNIEENSEMYQEWLKTMNDIEHGYMKMAELGAKSDQLRMLLPHSTKADVIMSANVTEWKHIFSLRCHTAAHPSVRLVMHKVLTQCYAIWPDFFSDQYREFIAA